MATLGVPDEYEAFLLDAETEVTLARLPWSNIKWQRAKNKITDGSVTVTAADGGIECCAHISNMRSWAMLLAIERNGVTVWDGPVVGWSRPTINESSPGDFTIRAKDRFAITMKRLVGQTRIGIESAGAHFYTLLADALIGNDVYDPYLINLPVPVPLLSSFSREYRVERLERVFDCIDELVRNTNAFYTCRTTDVIADERVVRSSLGHPITYDVLGNANHWAGRPVLNERSVIAVPGIEVDGLEMISAAYVGGSSEGQSGAPLIGTSTFWDGQYVSGLLEAGSMSSRASTQADLDTEALIKATADATARFTIEQTRLSPEFGCPLMEADLSNLLPGVWIDVDFESTCAFDQPFAEVRYEIRRFLSDAVSVIGTALTPIFNDRIDLVRLLQLDVEVDAGDDGTEETVLASFEPTGEWTGVLPSGWRDPSVED